MTEGLLPQRLPNERLEPQDSPLSQGELLVTYMRRSGMNGSELARLTTFTPPYISQLIHNRRAPSLRAIDKFSNILGLDPAERALLEAKADVVKAEISSKVTKAPR